MFLETLSFSQGSYGSTLGRVSKTARADSTPKWFETPPGNDPRCAYIGLHIVPNLNTTSQY
jgi:hypothetical protein